MEHVSLRHVVTKLRGLGDKWVHVRVLPDIISAWNMFFGEVPTYANLELAEKQDTNVGLREVAKICEGPGLGTALEEEYAAGVTILGLQNFHLPRSSHRHRTPLRISPHHWYLQSDHRHPDLRYLSNLLPSSTISNTRPLHLINLRRNRLST